MNLQLTWFVLVGILIAGYAVLDGFDWLGVLYPFLAKNEDERRALRAAIGRVGRQRSLAHHRRRRLVPPPSAGLRDHVRTLLPRHHARPLRAHLARRFGSSSVTATRTGAGFWDGAFFIGSLLRRCCSEWRLATSSAVCP